MNCGNALFRSTAGWWSDDDEWRLDARVACAEQREARIAGAVAVATMTVLLSTFLLAFARPRRREGSTSSA